MRSKGEKRPSRTFAERVQRTVWARRGIAGWLGYLALRPLSTLFGFGVGLRNLGYAIGVLRSRKSPVPVISVGNLAVGGTGKTPFTLWLSTELAARGYRVGIVLRGYKGKAAGVTVVSRGNGPEIASADSGDEAAMLARRFPGPVVIAPHRVAGATEAAALGCDVVVLDDAFQHRAIRRAFDVVLLDGRRGPLLPAGPLRERVGAARRADAVVLVQNADRAVNARLPKRVAAKPLYRMRVVPSAVVEVVRGQWIERPISLIAGRHAVAVVGIARPEGFYDLLNQWDVLVDEVFEFPDHHRYSLSDWRNIARRGQNSDLVLTTEKDLVKLQEYPFATGKLLAVRISAEVDGGDQLLGSVVDKIGADGQNRRGTAPVEADAAGAGEGV